MNISSLGTTHTKELHTTKVCHINGDLDLVSKSAINIDAPDSININSSKTVVNGDLSVNGKFKFDTFSIDSLEGNALTVQGDSILQGSLDLKGPLDVSSIANLKSGATINNGDLCIESDNALLDNPSSNFFVLGNGSEGSLRIGVLDNKLTFQRHNGTQWHTVNQMGDVKE